MSPSTSTGRSTTPRRRPEGGAPAGGASSAARPSSGGRPSAGKARSKSTNQSRAKSASRRDDRRGFRSENGSATASNFAPKKPSIIPIEVGPDNGFVKIGVPANLAGILGVWIYPNTRELAHAPSVVHSKLGQRVNHQLLNVIYIGASVGRAVDSVLGPQTQNGVTNQLTRSVIRNVSTPLHFNEICTDISWRTAQVICQVGGVSIGKNMWVLK